MTLFKCDVDGCLFPSVRRRGSCTLCERHLCKNHLKPDFHRCPDSLVTEEEEEYFERSRAATIKEINALISRVNVDALRDRAMTIRQVPCIIPEIEYDSAKSMMGGMNYHIPINFVDGVTWLCRIRRHNVTSTPLAHQNLLIESEAATYHFLSSRTSIPVPKVHDYALCDSPSNAIGVGYILIDKLDGVPLSDRVLGEDDRKHVLNQLADIFISLKQHPFSEIGCLSSPESLSIGPILEECAIDTDQEGHLRLLGPFNSALEYRKSSIKHQIQLILRGESYTRNAIDAYLVHRFILDNIIDIITKDDQGKFFLKHMDDKGDHILVDNAFNIVGVIDWEWAQTTTLSEAFSAPLYLLDVGEYYGGSNKLSREESEFASILAQKGQDSLASAVTQGRIAHRLAHCVGGDTDDPDSLPDLFMGLLKATCVPDPPFDSWDQWRESMLSRYGDDDGLKLLIECS
ncbi:hypothetical protein M413DRAFT_443157 [Hebeloma cylindrosporum]|uniref:Aminoglycoside phosphotransferase domain-containing protein n=1 Tax=Hebeloma cylindrosporum TaxID=76867 RepID=A0A0C3CK54_HEBCY|nr:hypothetical protein M413DRAFT_443157 [Hebeloma cylindrosporum h7]